MIFRCMKQIPFQDSMLRAAFGFLVGFVVILLAAIYTLDHERVAAPVHPSRERFDEIPSQENIPLALPAVETLADLGVSDGTNEYDTLASDCGTAEVTRPTRRRQQRHHR